MLKRRRDGTAPRDGLGFAGRPEARYRRSRLRITGPTGVMLTVLVPIAVHVMGTPPTDFVERGRRYYISPHGDDSSDASSPERAWRTLKRARAVNFRPGDQILLEGGARFPGSIRLGPAAAGDPSNPVVVASYGSGRATIEAAGGSAITVFDTAGVEIRNLVLAGDQASYRSAGGIKLYSDLPGDRKLDHVVISGFEVTGFQNGIEIGGGRGATGFRDVAIRDGALHGNRDAGLVTYGPPFNPAAPRYAHESVSVSGVQAFDNLGNPDDQEINSGSGVVLGSVRGALVEHSTAHDNGARCLALTGPVGIWAYDSADVVIQHNVAFHNRTAGSADGGGFDLDQNVSSSVLQYNLSYENAGAGYLIYSSLPNAAHTGNVVRFNISGDDGRNSSFYGAISVFGTVSHLQLYHNTVVVSGNGPNLPAALALHGPLSGIAIRNNVFVGNGTQPLSASDAFRLDQVLLQGNDLFAAQGQSSIGWGTATFAGMADWRDATGQERVDGTDSGLSIDPGFIRAPAALGTDRAVDYLPGAGSALADGAVDLRALGVDPGPIDFFGRSLTRRMTIGAIQAPGK